MSALVIYVLSFLIFVVFTMSCVLIIYDAIKETKIFEKIKPFVLLTTVLCGIALLMTFLNL